MIQSDKFDSYMNIKKTYNFLLNFAVKRLAEIFGLLVLSAGSLLLIALLTYSPEDPNFIFPHNTVIKNLLGFQGSYVSDLFFQSLGLVSYLVSITFILTGINIFRNKEFFLIIENTFFAILYCISGTLFLGHYYSDSFTFYINGNSGFVGSYIQQSFLGTLIKINESVFYYILIFIALFFFLTSINLRLINFYSIVNKFFNYIFKKKDKTYTDKSEIIQEYIPQEQIKDLIQEDLPFIKAESKNENKIKFRLPSFDL